MPSYQTYFVPLYAPDYTCWSPVLNLRTPSNKFYLQFVELHVDMYKIWVRINSWALFLLMKGYVSFSCYPNALTFERFISLCKVLACKNVHNASISVPKSVTLGEPSLAGVPAAGGFFFPKLGLRDVCKMIYVCTKASLRRLK